MRIRRVAAATTVAALAGGAALLISTQGSFAATPAPTPISLNLTGMASQACPLPLNGQMAIQPGTAVRFTPDLILNPLSSESLTIKPAPDSTDPKSSTKLTRLSKTQAPITFKNAGTYALSWTTTPVPLLGIAAASQTGKLIISTNAQKCVVAVSVPQPSVSVPGAGPVNSIVNGVVGGVVSGVNSAVAPVNSAVGPILGGANGALGGVTGGSTNGGGANAGKPANGSGLGTIYTPSDLTPAQRRVPQGGGAGGGGAGSSSQDGSSVNAPALGFKGVGSGSTAKNVKSGGSPNTVDLAAAKPRSALDGWANLIVLVAVLALSGATAFYARTYLLHPLPAKAHARS